MRFCGKPLSILGRQKLNATTNGLGLGDDYGATLDRIKAKGGEQARLGVDFPCRAVLGGDQLLYSTPLTIEIGSPNLNTDNIPPTKTLPG